MSPTAAIVIPVLNEGQTIVSCLRELQRWRPLVELIVVDGGSADATVSLAEPLADRVLTSPRGRALQMNAGAAASGGRLLMFLHADTRLPASCDLERLAEGVAAGSGWGFFALRLSGRHPAFRLIERGISWRSRLTGVGTGDQLLFVRRELFAEVGGYPPIPLMEDVALSKMLRARGGPPLNPGMAVTTSSRRWEQRGILPTTLLMWWLRLRYFCGADPRTLHRRYYG
jgi:rSAM/selenodomain-associated transferase 2